MRRLFLRIGFLMPYSSFIVETCEQFPYGLSCSTIKSLAVHRYVQKAVKRDETWLSLIIDRCQKLGTE